MRMDLTVRVCRFPYVDAANGTSIGCATTSAIQPNIEIRKHSFGTDTGLMCNDLLQTHSVQILYP